MSDEIWTPISEIPAAWRHSFERAVRQLDMPFRAGYYYRYWIEEEEDAQILAACQKLTEMHYASNGSFNSLGDFNAHRWIADRRRQKRILAHEHRDFDLMLALNAFGGSFAEELLSHLNYELSLLEFDTGERNAKGQLPSIVASNIVFCYHRARKLGCPPIENIDAAESRENGATEVTDSRGRGRPRMTFMYPGDASIIEEVIAACDLEGSLTLREAIRPHLDRIQPPALGDNEKIRRIRDKARKFRPDLE